MLSSTMRYLAVSVLIVVCACHKRADKALFGTQVAPPGILAQVRPGMTVAQLHAIAPELEADPAKGLLLASPASNVKLYALTDGDVVSTTYVDLQDASGTDLLTAAWGPPDAEKDRESPDELAWRSTATGWRARVFCGHGTDQTPLPPFCTIHFHPHKPIEAMFGKAIAPPGELARVTPAMPQAALKAATNLPFERDTQSMIRRLDFDGAVEEIGVVDGRLFELSYVVPVGARAAIDKAWGQPAVTPAGEAIWFDASTGWSVIGKVSDGKEMRLHFIGYRPFDRTLDLLVALSAFKSVAEARAAHGELDWRDDKRGPHLSLPPSELSGGLQRSMSSPVEVYEASGGLHTALLLDPKRASDVIALLTARWGAPKIENAASTREPVTYSWAGHATVRPIGDSGLAVVIGP